jgi:hypothetical protein
MKMIDTLRTSRTSALRARTGQAHGRSSPVGMHWINAKPDIGGRTRTLEGFTDQVENHRFTALWSFRASALRKCHTLKLDRPGGTGARAWCSTTLLPSRPMCALRACHSVNAKPDPVPAARPSRTGRQPGFPCPDRVAGSQRGWATELPRAGPHAAGEALDRHSRLGDAAPWQFTFGRIRATFSIRRAPVALIRGWARPQR